MKGKGKRPLRADDDIDDFGEAPDDGEPEAKRNRPDKPKIACPYMKRFPAEFCTWRTCVGPGFDGMNRMKEHLKRRHFKENGCHRCGLYLESNQALQEHLRSIDICPIREILPQMGFMTQTQWYEISKKRQIQMTPLQERWKEIYLILFPEVDESSIPGPYFEASEISDGISNTFDPREYEGFLKQQLPARLLTNLNREFQLFSEFAKLKLAEILKEESLAILKAYVLQKGGHSVQISEKPAQSSGTEAFNTRMPDSGLFDTIETFGDEGHGEFDLSILDIYYQQSEKGQGSEKAGVGHDSSVISLT
ncbi:hypothetical protein CGCSCA4_v006322 [Colletotrichum siamense]|uniref:C2H2-type domain-containing protein n=1 Tax=Colletotrichum siamense TaxID=690259 RepID=A0A9P5EFG5_COLSI|nr:hypothetical protein CGCSCA4_v006322 [Colletotrichum siamense]KAF4852131.1 hypothetical protein CGCSCA2_v010563 [Colletotrichum siamense]